MADIKVQDLTTYESANNRQGALIIDGTPFYMIDLFYNDRVPFIAGFPILESSVKQYKQLNDFNVLAKDYDLVVTKKRKFRLSTELAIKLVSSKGLKDTQTSKNKKKYKEPIFISAITEGTSTITGEYTDAGFYEKSNNGKATGVFVSLQDVSWYTNVRDLNLMVGSLKDLSNDYIRANFSTLSTSQDKVLESTPVTQEDKDLKLLRDFHNAK